jgi:riboflavin synthase
MVRVIVEGTGGVAGCVPAGLGARLTVELPAIAADLAIGQSVAINGACLTVAGLEGAIVAFDLAGETLRRTNLGALRRGDRVNYERAMRLDERIDGHLVQGHVDGTGRIASFDERHGDAWLVVEAPRELLVQMVDKGCVAVDGISLTLAALERDRFACTIVPHTRAITNLAARRAGDAVNLECDVLIKWLARLHQQSRPAANPRGTVPGVKRRTR